MNQIFHSITSKLSLFWRYFFLLAAMVAVSLAALTIATRQSAQALQSAYLDQSRETFCRDCERFSGDLRNTSSLISSIEASQYYIPANLAGLPLTSMDDYYFSELRKAFQRQCTLLDLPGESFLYFDRTQICLTRNRLFLDAANCFDSYLSYDIQPSLQNQLHILATGANTLRTMHLLPSCFIRVGDEAAASYLTLLVRSPFRDQVYGFLYPKQTILDCFHLSSLPPDTCLQLIQDDGTVLFSHGVPDEDWGQYTRFSARLSSLSCTAIIGIPHSYFQDAIQDAQHTAHHIFLVCTALGVVMCLAFSWLSVKPFRRLIRDHSAIHPSAEVPANELVTIDRFLRGAQEKTAALGSMLLSSLLVRAYSGLAVSEDEYPALSAAFPLFQYPLRAAIVRDCRTDQPQESVPAVIQLLRSALPDPFLCEYINPQESVVLFRDSQEEFELLQCALLDLNKEPRDHPRFVCGVSAPFMGLKELSRAIRQAQFSVPDDGECMLVLFSEEPDPDAAGDGAGELKQFQQALNSWNRQEVLDQLEAFARSAAKRSSARPEELFYNLLYLLRDAAHTAKLTFDPQGCAAYRHTNSPASNIRALRDVADNLFQQRSLLQTGGKQQLKEGIVQYVEAHFSDSSLDLYQVAQHFCVSVRFVQNVVQSVTGKNFINFLTDIRVEQAARLLRETQIPISTVAEQVGYPVLSTFYRNFKKRYHVTPVEYKETETLRS